MSHHHFEFGPFRFDPAKQTLTRGGAPVPLNGKASELLQALVEHRGEVLDKDQLMQRLWPETVVEENNLTVQMTALRKALGDSPNERRYIATIPGRGYRFVAEVREQSAGPEEPGVIVAERTRMSLAVEEEERVGKGEKGRRGEAGQGHHSLSLPLSFFHSPTRRWLLITASVALLGLLGALAYWWKTSQSAPAQTGLAVSSLAVLPFKPLKAGSSEGYLELGIADALITRLSNLKQLAVRPTSAVLKYAAAPPDPLAAGRELGVDSLLDGRIQQDGDRLRVTVQLLRLSDGRPLWAEQFDARFTDIFAVEDAISQQVAQALTLKLSGEEQQRLTKRETDNAEAYRLYLKGRYQANQLTREGFEKGIQCFQQAIALDPNYVLAHDGLAYYYIQALDLVLSPREAMPKAKEAALRALALDPHSAEVHFSLAMFAWQYEWNWAEAEREFKRAIELNPSFADAHGGYSFLLSALGRAGEALAEGERYIELTRRALENDLYYQVVLYFTHQYDRALEQGRVAIKESPNFWLAHVLLGRTYEQRGQFAEAVAEYEKARSIDDSIPEVLGDLGRGYALSGRRAEAEKVLDELRARARRGYVAPYNFATIYIGLGDKAQAFAWLEQAYQERSWYLTWLKVAPIFDSLRPDPRFADLVRRVGLAP